MNTVIIVQARMTSTRLPGKILKTVFGKPLLQYQVERLRKVQGFDRLVVATTTNPEDDAIVDFCTKHQVDFFRGSEHDVLQRYFQTALKFKAEHVVRVTSDCPLIDPAIVSEVIAKYHGSEELQTPASGSFKFDYVSNTRTRTFPRGMDTEIFSFAALKEVQEEATCSAEREHVTPFIYQRPDRYRIGEVCNSIDLSKYRLTVDVSEDLKLIEIILEHFCPTRPDFTMDDVVSYLIDNPATALINAHVEQKKTKF